MATPHVRTSHPAEDTPPAVSTPSAPAALVPSSPAPFTWHVPQPVAQLQGEAVLVLAEGAGLALLVRARDLELIQAGLLASTPVEACRLETLMWPRAGA